MPFYARKEKFPEKRSDYHLVQVMPWRWLKWKASRSWRVGRAQVRREREASRQFDELVAQGKAEYNFETAGYLGVSRRGRPTIIPDRGLSDD